MINLMIKDFLTELPLRPYKDVEIRRTNINGMFITVNFTHEKTKDENLILTSWDVMRYLLRLRESKKSRVKKSDKFEIGKKYMTTFAVKNPQKYGSFEYEILEKYEDNCLVQPYNGLEKTSEPFRLRYDIMMESDLPF